jgi:hypothetical protein
MHFSFLLIQQVEGIKRKGLQKWKYLTYIYKFNIKFIFLIILHK